MEEDCGVGVDAGEGKDGMGLWERGWSLKSGVGVWGRHCGFDLGNGIEEFLALTISQSCWLVEYLYVLDGTE